MNFTWRISDQANISAQLSEQLPRSNKKFTGFTRLKFTPGSVKIPVSFELTELEISARPNKRTEKKMSSTGNRNQIFIPG